MPPRAGGGATTGVGEDTAAAAAPTTPVPGRDGLLADIRGGARLKKVSDTEKRDRSQAMVPGSESSAPAPPSSGGAPAPGGDAGGLAGALASALAIRKSKVSHSGKVLCMFVKISFMMLTIAMQTMKRMTTIGSECFDLVDSDSLLEWNTFTA